MSNSVVNEHAQGSFFRVATRMTDKLGNRIRSEYTFNRKTKNPCHCGSCRNSSDGRHLILEHVYVSSTAAAVFYFAIYL
jgi:hypothetical protein